MTVTPGMVWLRSLAAWSATALARTWWTLFSGLLLLLGVWMLCQTPTLAAVIGAWFGVEPARAAVVVHSAAGAVVAGSQFLFMFLVADDLCPDAPMVVSGFLEFFVAVLAMSFLARTLWLTWGLMG